MVRQSPAMHVVTSKRRHKDREYETTLVRRSYRDGDRVRKQTLANLSHLPPEAIEAVRRVLRGETLVGAGEALQVERSLGHGHVAAVLGVLRDLDLERLISRERCRERDLCVALICQRLLAAGSKLSATRRFAQTTLAEALGLGTVSERELLSAMDWLLARQARIEHALAKRHLAGDGYVLYDLSSSYVEGRCCPLAAIGYSRDGKRDSLQITYGLICAPDGRPVAIELHRGNTADPRTVPAAAAAVAERFGLGRAVIVGDRGMLTDTQIAHLVERRLGFISALRAPQIAKLTVAPAFPLSLFDEYALAEIAAPEFPGERLIVCRNPAVAAERARKRADLLAATERELDKITASVGNPRGRLHGAPAADIARRAGAVVNKHKMAKHFELEIADGRFAYRRKQAQIDEEALLDGLYVIRTDQAAVGARRGARLQAAQGRRTRVPPAQEPRTADPADLPPPRRPRARPRLRVHARLLRAVRTQRPARPAALHRRHPDRGRQPRQAGATVTDRRRQDQHPPQPRRPPTAHARRPARRARHAHAQPHPHPRHRAPLPPAQRSHAAASTRARPARRHAHVVRTRPPETAANRARPPKTDPQQRKVRIRASRARR